MNETVIPLASDTKEDHERRRAFKRGLRQREGKTADKIHKSAEASEADEFATNGSNLSAKKAA